MGNDYLSVSDLTSYIKKKFDRDPYLDKVYLTGEISNFRLRPAHQYFSLKDDNAKISAIMFKSAFDKVITWNQMVLVPCIKHMNN